MEVSSKSLWESLIDNPDRFGFVDDGVAATRQIWHELVGLPPLITYVEVRFAEGGLERT